MSKYYHIVTYKRKIDKENLIWEIYPLDKSLDIALKQLKNMSVSFNGNVVLGINDLEYFKIEERDYLFNEDGEFYFNRGKGEDVGFMPLSEQASIFGCDESDLFDNHNKDITNKLLFKYNIHGNDYLKIGKVLFENNILEVNSHIFKLEEGKKLNELFDLLFRAKAYYKKKTFSYNMLKELLHDNIYKELKTEHINKDSINDIVGKKIKAITIKTKMKYKILLISPTQITIRQESAL